MALKLLFSLTFHDFFFTDRTMHYDNMPIDVIY